MNKVIQNIIKNKNVYKYNKNIQKNYEINVAPIFD